MKKKSSYHWDVQKSDKNNEIILCPPFDPYADFCRDPSGFYVLIRVSFEFYAIEVAVCDAKHKVVKTFRGRNAQDLYHHIFRYEKKHKLRWLTEKTHIAYLGKELKKAETALVMGHSSYFQE